MDQYQPKFFVKTLRRSVALIAQNQVGESHSFLDTNLDHLIVLSYYFKFIGILRCLLNVGYKSQVFSG